MSTEKKVIFSGQDNVSQKAKQMYSNLLADSKKYGDTLKEQTGYINQQIKALEKKAKLESKEGRKSFEEQGELYRAAKTPQEREKYAGRTAQIRKELEESSATIEVLKSIFQEAKKQSAATDKLEKSQQKFKLSSEDQYKSMQSLARQEFRENKQGVLAKIKAAEKGGYSNMDVYTAEKVMYQKSLAGDQEKPKSMFGPVFYATLAAGLVQQIASALGKIIGTQSGEQGLNTLLGGIPFVGGILGGASGRTFEEQLAIQSKELELKAKTGKSIRGLSNQTGIGYSTRESLAMTEGLVGAAGNARGANQTGNALLLQRGLGLSTEAITQIVKDLRTTRSSADIMQIASDVLKANPELRRDQTKFAEILQQTSQLTNTLASQTENVDIRKNAGMVGALRSIGGSFADPNLGPQRMLSINQSLTQPGTEYQKARGFGVLSGLNPGASYFQMLEAQEQGIGKKGYLSGMLNQLKRETGGGENMMLGVNQNLGLGASTSRKLVEAFEKNPKMFDDLAGGGKASIEKVLGLTQRAEGATSERDKEKAEIDNAFAMSATAGTMKVASLTFEAGAEMFKSASLNLSKTVSTFGNQIVGKMQGKSDSTIAKENAIINKLYEE